MDNKLLTYRDLNNEVCYYKATLLPGSSIVILEDVKIEGTEFNGNVTIDFLQVSESIFHAYNVHPSRTIFILKENNKYYNLIVRAKTEIIIKSELAYSLIHSLITCITHE